MYRLTEPERQSLLRQRESGMGYQVVEAVTPLGLARRGVAYNAELLLLDSERDTDRRTLSLSRNLSEAVTKASSSVGMFRSLTVVSDARTTVLLRADATKASSIGASDAPIEKTAQDERFYRFSAFANDNRVQPDNSLSPGSYATPEADGNTVKTGAEAVERYALPNPDPASYRFKVSPVKDTQVQRGIVQPANGHMGGGAEVIFTAGTTKDTVTQPPTQLPDK